MTIFILGAGVMQLPAINVAREMGWTVAVADGNPRAVGAGLADRFFDVDLKDLEGLEAAARAAKAELGLDGVFTAGTDFSASVAWVAARLGLPGIPYETALRASDKLRMRGALAAAGVPSARFAAVSAGEAPAAAAVSAGLELPLVVKPADSMGARGCRLARTESELDEAVACALSFSRSGRAIVEEYLAGPEFSVDALVVEGELRIRGFADRHIAFAPFFVELGHTMPSSAPPERVAEILSVFAAGVKAIGIERGAAKGDMKYCESRGGPVVGEIAARLSGGYMSGWTYPYASGIEVTREALLIAVGRDPGSPPPERGWVSAERAFISIPGSFGGLVGERRARCRPYVKDFFLRPQKSETLGFPSNNVEKCGNIISQAPDRAAAVAAAEGAVGDLLVRLAPCDERTEAFLRGEGRIRGPDGDAWPPPAFPLAGETLRSLKEMPEWLDRDEGAARLPAGAPPLSVAPWAEADGVEPRDWSGRSLAESASLALEIAGLNFGIAGRRVLAGRFWRALALGGAQAGLYVIDSAQRKEE